MDLINASSTSSGLKETYLNSENERTLVFNNASTNENQLVFNHYIYIYKKLYYYCL